MNEEEIFQGAADMPAAERAAYLATACVGQPALRQRIERLLASHDHDAFMARPADRTDSPELEADLARLKPEAGEDRIGNFKLLQKIGEGGFGTVWMAEQLEPVRRRVALKIIKPGMDTKEVIVRFEQERQALALMDHPNIAKVLDAGVTPLGRPFFVMELVRGIRITDFCDQNHLPTAQRLDLFVAVCHAIQHAHQKGIIHRDIKPSNILVTLHDGVPVPKVIDFGVAKAIQSQRLTDLTFFTRFEQMIGTPLYMSPEQAEMSGLDIDTRSDIYSLGVLLYELLTGQTPFDAKELMALGIDAMRKTIREKEPVRPSTKLSQTLVAEIVSSLKSPAAGKPATEEEVRASSRRLLRIKETITLLRGDLDWIVMKCLEKDRTRRYETANGLAADIQRHLNNEPVTARPPSAAYRFQKLVRRNKLAFAAVTSVAAVLVLGVVVSFWQAIRATRASASEAVQRKLAETQRNVAETQRNAAVEQRKLADMQLALQAWEEGDLKGANDLIDASRPAPGETPRFEWRYLRKLCQDQSHETFGGSNHKYRSAQFFDRDLLLLNDGKALTLHDLSRGKNQLLLDDQDGIWSPAFCSGNTNLLATLTDDGRIKVWDLAARRVRVESEGHPRSPTAAFDADDTLTFSRAGRWLASATSDNSLKLWDVEAGDSKPARTVHRYASWASGGVFSPDGRHLFSGGSEPMIRIWDVATGAEAAAPLDGHTAWVYALAFSLDGLRLASGGADSTVILWDVSTRKIVTKFIGHIAMVKVLAFSPDGQILASGSRDHTIRLWDTKTGQQLSLLRGHGAEVKWLSFSPDGQLLVSRSDDGLVKLWQATPALEGNALTRGRSSLEVALSPDGRRLASVGAAFAVDLWDLSTRSRTLLNGHSNVVMCAAFSSDGRILATGSHDQTVRLWDVSDHRTVATLANGFPVGSLAFSPDGRTLIVGGSKHYFLVGDRGGLQFWDVPSQQATGTIPGDASDIVQVALSARGSLLATGHKDGAVTLWDAQTRRLLRRFGSQVGGAVLSLAFSPTEPLLAASDWGGNIALYNTTTMEVVPPPLRAHTGRVTSLAFSPDGRTLASAGEGGGLKLWRVATRQVALTLKGHVSAVKGIAFSRDGTFMASCGLDGTVRLWPAAPLEEADAATKTKKENQ
ncbi:MAG: protein kinase [Verrucomicrobia bacterium]|nr:protein kinase [Verrucomicrobiota bacterium]